VTDPYLDPNSEVLRNRLGITDPHQLTPAEADLTLAAIQDLNTRTLPGAYNLAHLRTFHREIFGDIYTWAGQIRTVSIAKTDAFCLPQHIEPYAANVFDALAKELHLRELERAPFIHRLTHYLAEINAIHPFREGNGRAQRAFFRQLSHEAGWPIDWSRLDRKKNDHASAESLRGNNQSLQALLDQLIGS
jgi:cell filamentation protein